MQRLATLLIAVLALAVFGAAGYVVFRNDPVPDAGQVVGLPSSTPDPIEQGGASKPAVDPPSSAATDPEVVAFLGDDWTKGVGASTRAERFSTLLSGELGLTEHNFGVPDTGYAKSSASGGDYLDRVPKVVAARPDIVVVSGGRNDRTDDLGTLQSNVTDLFAELHSKLPDATLIAIEPMWGDSSKPAELGPITAAVHKAVQAVGGHYIALNDPINGHSEYMSDAADPNDQGYAAIATALQPKIAALIGA